MGVPLSKSHPELAMQARGWNPDEYSAGSHAKLEWECSKGHSWEARLSSRAGHDANGCPYCSRKAVMPGENDLATLFPEIAKEADGWDPSQVLSKSSKKMAWKCSQGHNWVASIGSRTGVNKTGCSVCANRKLQFGINDLLTCSPEVARDADGWDPKTVLNGTASRKNWVCKLGHNYSATVESRTGKKKAGCPICSGQKMLVGFNDLATAHPEIAAQAYGWDPSEFSPGSNKKMDWLCKKGHVWNALISNRTKTGAGCHFCSNLRLLPGFNDLETTHPQLALEADGWDPKSKIAGSHEQVSWKCSNGHRWKTKLGSRTATEVTGCPTCATSGFDPNKDGWLYFLEHPEWEMLQIGITNVPKSRLSIHKRSGWQLIEIRGPMNGDLARQWEVDILNMLRHEGAMLAQEKIAGRFSGYTESWITSSFPARTLKELMDKVRSKE